MSLQDVVRSLRQMLHNGTAGLSASTGTTPATGTRGFGNQALPFNGAMPYYLFYDDEIAGNRSQQICQIGYVVTDQAGRILEQPTCQLIQPQCNFEKQCIKVHGITEQTVWGAPTLGQYCQASQFMWLLSNCILVAHNAKGADLYHIKKSLTKAGIPMPKVRYVDTMEMARSLGFQTLGLDDLCQFFQVPLGTHHNATEDATACYQIFGRMLQMGAVPKPKVWSSNQTKKAGSKKKGSSKQASKPKKKRSKSKSASSYYDHKKIEAVRNNTVYGSNRSVNSVLHEFRWQRLLISHAQLTSLDNRVIVVSGEIPNHDKRQIEKQIEILGGTSKANMSQQVNLLVICPGVGPRKLAYALEHRIQAISAAEFQCALAKITARQPRLP